MLYTECVQQAEVEFLKRFYASNQSFTLLVN